MKNIKKILREELENNNVGYHAGNLQYKSEGLKDRNYIIGKTGQLGTGYYFYGTPEMAIEHAKKYNARKINDERVFVIDLNKYNLFKPNNPVEYYDNLIIPMNNQILKYLTPEDFTDVEILETLYDANDFFGSMGIKLTDEKFIEICKEFVNDLTTKSSSKDTMFNNRVLEAAGYEGVDMRGTKYDSFAVGSVIFEMKPNTFKEYE